MTDLVYRFRSIENLLGEFQELERQQIFFASREQLNDPMEGYKRFFWLGDRVLWENLFRHYIQGLFYACSMMAVANNEHPIGWSHVPFRSPSNDAPTSIMFSHLDELTEHFFAHEAVQVLIRMIGERQRPVQENELRVYLTAIHPLAIIEVFALMRRHGLLTARQHDDHIAIDHAIKGISQITDLLLLMDKEEQNNATLADAREHIFSAQINVSRQLDLIHRLSGATRTLSANEVFVFVDFPNEYPGQLESLVFPKYYTACFSTNCSNSSMWGHYSDSHRGVCLIFNVQPWNDGLAIKLRRVVGTNSQGPFLGEAAHPLHHVQYQTDYPEIDFFALFGMLPIPIINSDWYHDRQKNQTTREDCTTVLTDERHRAHWRQFERIFSTKTNDWAYEEETRITMQDYLLDLESPTQRLATYEFSSLHGIVFGINTCTDDKMKIIDIISTKCLETKRRDFKFYQAFYSSATAKIELSPLSLISFENKPQQQPKT